MKKFGQLNFLKKNLIQTLWVKNATLKFLAINYSTSGNCHKTHWAEFEQFEISFMQALLDLKRKK